MNTDQKEFIVEVLSSSSNSRIFAAKVRELKKSLVYYTNWRRDINSRMLARDPSTHWQSELVIQLFVEPEIQKLERDIKKFDYYRKRCLGQVSDKEVDITAIKEDVLIKDILAEPTGKSTHRWHYTCPLPNHVDSTPSFVWYKHNNSWYCFGCHKGGDNIKLVMDMHGEDFKGALKYLSGV